MKKVTNGEIGGRGLQFGVFAITSLPSWNFSCSKLTLEILEQVKCVQSQQQRHQKDVIEVAMLSLLLTLNIFHTLF